MIVNKLNRRGKEKIKVFVVDDHNAFRQYLCELLYRTSDIEVVGSAENGKIAVELAKTLKPDVVLMDVRMPVMNGIEATRQITRESPNTKIIAFSSCLEEDIIERMSEAGASDYLLKGTGLAQILAVIKDTYNVENIDDGIKSCFGE